MKSGLLRPAAIITDLASQPQPQPLLCGTAMSSQPQQSGEIQVASPSAQNGVVYHPHSVQSSVNEGCTVGQSKQGAVPQSQSFHGAASMMSPPQTAQPDSDQDSNMLFSPPSSQTGSFTEPRNYAPRTSGQPVMEQPPPQFNLDMVAYRGRSNTNDPFAGSAGANGVGQVAPPTQAVGFLATDARSQRSEKLGGLLGVDSVLPSFNAAMHPDNFPFAESCRKGKAINFGVVKIRNIPFSTKRAEVVAFLGRNSRILNDADEPVHIIMERVTSKTMDAYVEFCTLEDAMKAVERHHVNVGNGRPSRLGDRAVDVELSSQGHLMKDLFPLAVGIFWNGATPEFKPFNEKEPWENFKGFISEEEMIMLVKHVEVPHRSPFSKECPQRPYECLISTLKKFPWSSTDRITISQRRSLFKATCDLIRLLNRAIYKNDDPINLNNQLYRRLIKAAMQCPGFTPLMKDDIAFMANFGEDEQKFYGQPELAHAWRHQYAISIKQGFPEDVVEWFISMIREQSHRDMMCRSITERNDLQEKARDTDMLWGYFWDEVGYERSMGPNFDGMTLAQAAHAELAAIERILARALPNY